MRALSARQAGTCETAKTKVCRCRCGGLLHGLKRSAAPDAKFLAALPPDDPHHVDDAEQKRERRRIARNAKQGRLWDDGLKGAES